MKNGKMKCGRGVSAESEREEREAIGIHGKLKEGIMAVRQFSSKSLSLIERATIFAAKAHQPQPRKGTKTPTSPTPLG